MASLLDFVVAQRNPRLAGLLGTGGPEEIPNQQPVSAPQGQALPSLMGERQTNPSQVSPPGGAQPTVPQRRGPQGLERILGQLVGGFDNPNLPPEANSRARKQALVMGGLASFGSDKRGIARLADAALIGQQVGERVRQQEAAVIEETARRRQLANVGRALGAGRMSRAGVEKALQLAIAQGNHDSAKILQDTLSEYPEAEDPTKEMELVKIDPFGSFLQDSEGNFYDPFSKERVTEPPALPEDQEVDTRWETLYDEQSGEMKRVRFISDKNTGELLSRQVVGTAEAPEEVQEGDLAGMANQLERNLTTLSNVLEEDGVPNRIHNWSPNEFKPGWVRSYEAAAGNIDILASRMMFGARVSDSEREALSDVLTPRAGDDQNTIQQKMQNLEVLVEDFKKQQGIFDPDREEGSGGLGRYGLSGSVSAAGPDPFGDLGG